MYIDKDIIYSEPGKYLKGKNKIGFQFPLPGNFVEYDINFNDLKLVGNMFYYNDNLFVQKYNKSWTYGDYKKDIIKKRYSNDDQIAIILNKDDSEEDLLRYERMMKWRVFASDLANKIIKKCTK